ncbi:MAG: polyprenyl synthetase family protein [Pseudomonadota bacterium]
MTSLSIKVTRQVTMADVETAMIDLVPGEDGVIAQAARHHLGSGGGRVRANLALQSAHALKLSFDTSRAISTACELLHNASLVHDDLQDGDTIRRGKPAVWTKFGSNTAICLGDLMVSAAYAAIASARVDNLPEMIAHMHRRVGDVIGGQHDDLESDCTTIAAYNEVARMKSGPLLGLPVELCLIAAGRSADVSAAMAASDAIAIAYQTTDDIADAERDIDAGAVNFLAMIQGDMKSRTQAARLHASEYAHTAIAIAETLPDQSGNGLIALAEKFVPLLAIGEAA